MKKLLTVLSLLALVVGYSYTVRADEEYVAGGFEASGHVLTGVGYQRWKTTGAATIATGPIQGGQYGVLGKYTTATAGVDGNKTDDFSFFLDEVELDLSKTFGENIRVRADLDFGDPAFRSGRFLDADFTGGNNVQIEQAYATTNFAVGNGLEFLVGRFNAPIGFEAVDVGDNDSISHSALFRSLIRPINISGLKFYYPFTDAVDWHFYIVNSLTFDNGLHPSVGVLPAGTLPLAAPTAVGDSIWPSFGTRVGYSWGEEGSESVVGVSVAAGPEGAQRKKLTMIGDLDFNVWVSEAFAVGGEAIYRSENLRTGTIKGNYLGGILNLHYDFSDVWDGTFKYGFLNDQKGAGGTGSLFTAAAGNVVAGTAGARSLSGNNAKYHEVSLVGGYAVADNAKFKLEGNYTILRIDRTTNQSIFGGAALFAYNF